LTHIWHTGAAKALKHKIYRLERELLTRHPDRVLQMPQEVKDAIQQKKIPQRCIDKLTKEHEMYLRRVKMPTVLRPPRPSHG